MYNDLTPIWQLTIAEFRELIQEATNNKSQVLNTVYENEYVFGISGLAELMGTSKTTAQKIKSSGQLNKAITQVGRKIIINKKIALQILKEITV